MAVIHLRNLLLVAALAPLIFYAAAILCAWGFLRRRFGEHNRPTSEPAPDFTPPLTVLKPMRGSYRDSYANLASFCRQDYPCYEILFGVNDADDPTIPVIHRLMSEFPNLPISLVIGTALPGSKEQASNDKVAKLCRLAREAHNEILVVSDGDIRVAPDYLRRIADAFRDRRVGVVTSLYRGNTESNLWSELEDLSLTTDFLAGVLVARKLGVKFALGATMAVRREALDAIGGFESLADAAADDHELGRRIARRGYHVGLATTVPETECGTHNFCSYFEHHLRWAVVTRTSQPLGHAGFLFAQGLPWTIVALLLAPSWKIAAGFIAAYLVLRFALAFTLGSRGLGDPIVKAKWYLVPFRDALAFVIWCASLFLRRVRWQDSVYEVRRGRLIPVPERQAPAQQHVSTHS